MSLLEMLPWEVLQMASGIGVFGMQAECYYREYISLTKILRL